MSYRQPLRQRFPSPSSSLNFGIRAARRLRACLPPGSDLALVAVLRSWRQACASWASMQESSLEAYRARRRRPPLACREAQWALRRGSSRHADTQRITDGAPPTMQPPSPVSSSSFRVISLGTWLVGRASDACTDCTTVLVTLAAKCFPWNEWPPCRSSICENRCMCPQDPPEVGSHGARRKTCVEPTDAAAGQVSDGATVRW